MSNLYYGEAGRVCSRTENPYSVEDMLVQKEMFETRYAYYSAQELVNFGLLCCILIMAIMWVMYALCRKSRSRDAGSMGHVGSEQHLQMQEL